MADNNIPTYYMRAGMTQGSDSEAEFEFNGAEARLFVAPDGEARVHHVLKSGLSKKPVATGKVVASHMTGETAPRAFLTLHPKAKGAENKRYAMWKHVREDDAFWVIQPSTAPQREGTLFDL